MASLRFRNDKWQVQVRRHGHTAQAKSFQIKADAQRWARQIEAELDRALMRHLQRGQGARPRGAERRSRPVL